MPDHTLQTIGILGAGKVGTGIARQALKDGYEVKIATARPPGEIRLIVEYTAPGAIAASADDVMGSSDLVILAIPLDRYRTLDARGLAGKVAIDVMNYWAPTDGQLDEFEGALSSTVVQQHLRDTKLVRTLNHVGYHELVENALPAGAPGRQALAVAGDDPDARRLAGEFVDRLGFDPVDAGALRNASAFDIGTPIFGARLTRSAMQANLKATTTSLTEHQAPDWFEDDRSFLLRA